ncbi:MAG TPA: TonB family protein [Candidatus Udaeobacter sp.]|nr:TonB family protein [Candidatus Udaeobacter sp.]
MRAWMRDRTRWSMTASTVIHAAIVVWIVAFPSTPASQPPITEITLIDPGDLPGPEGGPASAPRGIVSAPEVLAASAAITDPTAVPAHVARPEPEQRFERAAKTGMVAPMPGAETAFADRLHARLATLQTEANRETEVAAIEASPLPTSALLRAPATQGGDGSGGKAPIELRRGGQGSGMAERGTGGSGTVSLNRGGSATGNGGYGGGLTELASAGLPAESRAGKSEPAPASEAVARRTLAGAALAGPIADRSILSYTRPEYPAWAKQEGVGGTVTLYFVVRPDGMVKENIMIQKTAGFEDFDSNAVQALSAWRFAPLPAGRTGDQWGTITFHFRLRDAG